MKFVKTLVIVVLAVFVTGEAFSADLSVNGRKAKAIYSSLEKLGGVQCQGKTCTVELAYAQCFDYVEDKSVNRCALIYWPIYKAIHRTGPEARNLYSAFLNGGVVPTCAFGACMIAIDSLSCVREKKFLGSRYNCDMNFE